MEIPNNREITVRTSYDEMEAYVLLPAISNDISYKYEDVTEALAQKNVRVGIDEDAIRRMIAARCYGREVLVAKGIPMQDGKDGFFQFNFNVDFNTKPALRPDGSVDYWSVHTVELVEEGQVIAVYHEPIDGNNGMTVTGKLLTAKRGRPLPPLTGRGFVRSEDNRTYTATTTGKIEKNENRIQISNVHEIYGNVDLTTGNIDFRGDVLVHGNVTPGMTVRATGSITVDGTVEACTIEAGKDIILRGGVLGAYRAVIKTKGNIYAKFMEYATVECDGFIEASSALDCTITCYDKIYMNGKQANIVGGKVYGVGGVQADCLGSNSEIHTTVQAGMNHSLTSQIAVLNDRIKEDTEVINKINAGLQQFDAMAVEKNINVKNDERRVALLRTKIMKQAQISAANEELNRMQGIAERSQGAKVRVFHDVFPGVSVSINDFTIQVKEAQQAVEFVDRMGKVVMYSIQDELVG